MNWQDQQQQFWHWITRPQDLRDSAQQIDELLAPHTGLSKVEALAIYNNAFHQRILQIASELYPVLYHTLGDEVFNRLWLEYLAAHLPRPGAMSNMTEELLGFVSAHEQFGKLPALQDIVRVETLFIDLFDRSDEIPYTLSQLQELPAEQWPGCIWQTKQDWALLCSYFDLEKYWRRIHLYIESGGVAGLADFGVERIDPEHPQAEQHYLLRRHQHRMQFQKIDVQFAAFLQGLREGLPFAEICAQLAARFDDQDIPALSLTLLLRSIDLELLVATQR